MRIQYEHTNCSNGWTGVYIVFCPIIVDSCLFKVVKVVKIVIVVKVVKIVKVVIVVIFPIKEH